MDTLPTGGFGRSDAGPRLCSPVALPPAPGVPLGEPQGDGLLGLDGMETSDFWLHARMPLPLRSAALPPFPFLGTLPGSQCPEIPTPWLPRQESVPWGAPRRAPVAYLTPQQDRDRDRTRTGTPSSASITAAAPCGRMTWRALWSTTCGTTGILRPAQTRTVADGTSAWTLPTTTILRGHGPVAHQAPPMQAAQSPGRDSGSTTR